MVDPEGTTAYASDGLDRLITVTDPAGEGRTVSYTEGASAATIARDVTGRMTGLTGSETASYVYDDAGQLTSAAIGPESWAYPYD